MAYTTIDDPSAHFQIALYTGASGDGAITNDGNSDLQPDMLWVKNRGAAQNHVLFDSSRGFNGDRDSLLIVTTDTDAESHNDDDHLKSFNSDGFTMQGSSSRSNNSSYAYAAWQWKANGGTTTTNDASATSIGDQDSVYQADTTSRFSIFTYGPLGSGGVLAHGLGAVPEVIIIKSRDGSRDWCVYHHKNTAAPETDFLKLNDTDATADATVWNDTALTSTTVSVSGDGKVGTDETYVAYAFAGVQGYSKFGTYVGNGNADGTFVYTGFRPAFLMVKLASSTGQNWFMFDNKRSPFNINTKNLYADELGAEGTADRNAFLSNGFKIRESGAGENGSGNIYTYLAFAEAPFVNSNGVPCNAR